MKHLLLKAILKFCTNKKLFKDINLYLGHLDVTVKIRWDLLYRDGQFRIIYYSRIVKPNPEYQILFFAISTINMKAFTTSLQQQKHNQTTSLLQCNIFKLSTCLPVKRVRNLVVVKPALEKDLLEDADVAGIQ